MIFGCAGLHCFALAFSSYGDGCSWLQCVGFSLQWLFLLWSIGSKHTGLVSAWCLESSWTRDQRRCPLHWQVVSYPLHHWGSPRQNFLKKPYITSKKKTDLLLYSYLKSKWSRTIIYSDKIFIIQGKYSDNQVECDLLWALFLCIDYSHSSAWTDSIS